MLLCLPCSSFVSLEFLHLSTRRFRMEYEVVPRSGIPVEVFRGTFLGCHFSYGCLSPYLREVFCGDLEEGISDFRFLFSVKPSVFESRFMKSYVRLEDIKKICLNLSLKIVHFSIFFEWICLSVYVRGRCTYFWGAGY